MQRPDYRGYSTASQWPDTIYSTRPPCHSVLEGGIRECYATRSVVYDMAYSTLSVMDVHISVSSCSGRRLRELCWVGNDDVYSRLFQLP